MVVIWCNIRLPSTPFHLPHPLRIEKRWSSIVYAPLWFQGRRIEYSIRMLPLVLFLIPFPHHRLIPSVKIELYMKYALNFQSLHTSCINSISSSLIVHGVVLFVHLGSPKISYFLSKRYLVQFCSPVFASVLIDISCSIRKSVLLYLSKDLFHSLFSEFSNKALLVLHLLTF